MKQNCRRNKEFRQEIVESANKIGICRTAVVYNISRVTVSKWLKKFRQDGDISLENKSRQHQLHPGRLPDETLEKIISAKTEHPDWSSLKIIKELSLKVSPATVLKKIKQHIKCETTVETSLNIYFDTIQLTGKASRFYRYLLSAREAGSGLLIVGFANENIALSQAIFADFVFEVSEWHNFGRDKITVYTGNGRYSQPGRERGSFVKLISQKYTSNILQGKISANLYKDIVNLAESLAGNSKNDLLLNCCLATAEINLNSTAFHNISHNLNFVQPFEVDVHLKSYLQLQGLAKQQPDSQIFNTEKTDLLTILIGEIVEKKRFISEDLFFRLLECAVSNSIKSESVALGFVSLAVAKKNGGDYVFSRKVLTAFAEWQKIVGKEYADYSRISAEIYQAEGNNIAALESFQQALALVEKKHDSSQEAEICGKIGKLHKKNGDNPQALIFFNRQEELARRYDLKEQIYSALINLGYFYASTGDLEKARFYYLKAHNLAVILANETYQAEVLSRLGNVYLYRNDLAEAEKCFLPIIKMGQSNKNIVQLGESHNKLAMLLVRKHDYLQALEHAGIFYNICSKLNNTTGMATAQRMMGICFLSLNEFRKALNCFRKDLQISRSILHKEFCAVAIGNLGTVFLNSGKPDKALNSFQCQYAIGDFLNNLRLKYTAITNSGIASLRLGDYEGALIFFEEQMKIARKSGEKLYIALAYQGRAQCLSELKRYPEAINSIKNAIKYFKQINDLSHACEAEIDLLVIKSRQSGKNISKIALDKLRMTAQEINRTDLLDRIDRLQ